MAFRDHGGRLEQVLNHLRAVHSIKAVRREGEWPIASALQEIGGGTIVPGVQQRPVRYIHPDHPLRLGNQKPRLRSVTTAQGEQPLNAVCHFEELLNPVATGGSRN